ncbi:hypothetical protein [Sphingomonas sp.]|uniref:hypothetical protein n=1 Tax=Sphingomonas sp. TaxID=28214 RepID=UPI003B00A5F9
MRNLFLLLLAIVQVAVIGTVAWVLLRQPAANDPPAAVPTVAPVVPDRPTGLSP